MQYTVKAERAFRWIIDILAKNRIPYQISGGLAAKAYGSARPLVDIDIDIPDRYFERLAPLVKRHIIFGPSKWRGEGFRVYLMTLDYKGQLIDIGGTDATSMWNRATKKWQPLTTNFRSFTKKRVMGRAVKFIRRKHLIAYKSVLDRRVDRQDLAALLH